MYPQLTLKASPHNSRGSVRPTDRVRAVTSTLNGSPNSWAALRSEQRGDPFRVDVPLVVLSAGRTDPRLLSGDPFRVTYGSMRIIIEKKATEPRKQEFPPGLPGSADYQGC